ncbi:heme NO-binding domain-containing protein [Roseitranquillus sediminis]|uniref:heme NO-binding domain-containing protein n=1 Tax=Roseitranquillus sediminis TaxID=2809051 RepID=UPI001D0C534B|nr:heme NO-binding domain-containing protein [Roseitranquillus sediminis]MBM9593131.1 heme NO-binding domain-containing protein [Roseitranquillus sediminis]
MHGLTNKAIESFVRDTYGVDVWLEVARRARLDEPSFEAMLSYEDFVTRRVLDAATDCLDKPLDAFLEDLGTYLVSHPTTEALRRLLRFGGETFAEFLDSLDDLPGRARLAVPDLDLPSLELIDEGDEGAWHLHCRYPQAGYGHVLVGILRALADDYGALVIMDVVEHVEGRETLSIVLHDPAFAEGRRFELAARAS